MFGKCLNFRVSYLTTYRDFPPEQQIEEITVMAWTKNFDGLNGRLFSTLQPFDEKEGVIAVLLPWDEAVRWRCGSPYVELVIEAGMITREVWRHWAFVHSRRKNLMAIYVDGELFASLNRSTTYVPPDDRNNLRFIIGGPNRFPGLIDEFAIFNIALPPRDIRTVMNRGLKTVLAVAPKHTLAVSWGEIKR